MAQMATRKRYVNEKIRDLIKQLKVLSQIVQIEPQAAYTCYTSGFKHKLTYMMRTILNVTNELAEFDFVG